MNNLSLERCPWCKTAKPYLSLEGKKFQGKVLGDNWEEVWACYRCSTCKNMILAQIGSNLYGLIEYHVYAYFPSGDDEISEHIPATVASSLKQAQNSTAQPDGCVMLCARAVDAMLQEKGFQEGRLYSRIEEAVKEHLITADMAKWAHQVRLESNDSRHVDLKALPSTIDNAKQCLEFTMALAEILFVLPARVSRGIETTTPQPASSDSKEDKDG